MSLIELNAIETLADTSPFNDAIKALNRKVTTLLTCLHMCPD